MEIFNILGEEKKTPLVILSPVQRPLRLLHPFHCSFFLPHKTIILGLPIPTLFFSPLLPNIYSEKLYPSLSASGSKVRSWGGTCASAVRETCGLCVHASTQLHGQHLVSRARGMFSFRAEPGLWEGQLSRNRAGSPTARGKTQEKRRGNGEVQLLELTYPRWHSSPPTSPPATAISRPQPCIPWRTWNSLLPFSIGSLGALRLVVWSQHCPVSKRRRKTKPSTQF